MLTGNGVSGVGDDLGEVLAEQCIGDGTGSALGLRKMAV